MALPYSPYPPVRQLNRNIVIGGSVVLFHVAAIWALQSGLLRRAVEIVVPVAILSDIVTPPMPKAEPVPQPPEPKPPEPVKPLVRKVERVQPPTPQPVAVPSPAPASPQSPAGVEAQAPPAPAVAAAPAPAPASAAKVEMPFIDAEYAPNEDAFRPPGISSRLGEYGTVVLKVTVGVNGMATQVQLVKSSGYPRLDNSALRGARQLKFKPATRDGVPIEYSYELPVRYKPQ